MKVDALVEAGLDAENAARYADALQFAQQARQLAENCGYVLGRGNAAGVLGLTYDAQGDYLRALQEYNTALTLFRQADGDDHRDAAITLMRIGIVYDEQGDYARAIEVHETALSIFRKTIGEDALETAALYENLGSVFYHQGDYQRSLQILQMTLNIQRNQLGEVPRRRRDLRQYRSRIRQARRLRARAAHP